MAVNPSRRHGIQPRPGHHGRMPQVQTGARTTIPSTYPKEITVGFFSSKADNLLQASTETGRAAYSAARNGETAVGTAYKAQSDADFDAWLTQTEQDYNDRKNQG